MRPAIALDPRLFGRGRRFMLDMIAHHSPSPALIDDFRLFATNFLGGFLFVAVYLA